MKNLHQIVQEKPTYKKIYQQWVQDNFTFDKAKCIYRNSASFVCTDKNCIIKHPMICPSKECSCVKEHKKCSLKNLESVLEQFQEEGKPRIETICDKLDECIDQIIDKISAKKQQIKAKLREGKADHLFREINQKKESTLDEDLKSKKLTGELIWRAIQEVSKDQKCNPQTQIIDEIVNHYKFLDQKGVDNFFSNIENLLLEPIESQMYLDLYHLSQQISINNGVISKIGGNGDIFSLLQPSISAIKGRFIKWKIQIINHSNSNFKIGIALKKFDSDSTLKPTCFYMNNSLGTTYSYQNRYICQEQKAGIQFKSQDIIEMEIDKFQWILKFKNLRSQVTSTMIIYYIPDLKQQAYHICFCLYSSNEKLQIISPVETSFRNYDI